MYSPNQSSPDTTIPGQAARGGNPSPRTRQMTPSTSAPAASRPSANAPGEYAAPALRIDTNADAHNTTVTAAAPAASRSIRRADRGGFITLLRLGG
jgi:hypothetical protein